MPVIMRGDATVTSWYPSVLPQPNSDTIARIAAMYASDPKLDAALARARSAHEMATDTDRGLAVCESDDRGGHVSWSSRTVRALR